MTSLRAAVYGIGLYGPGLNGWGPSQAILASGRAWPVSLTQLPALSVLPPAERRRVGFAVKLAMSTGFDALATSGVSAAQLPTVFSSTGGDCDNCHTLLETLASDDRAVSPTRFHNSVHNAPSGYWGIATGSTLPSTSLCAYDATFSAGLLDALAYIRAARSPCLLIAYDTAYPEPLNALRPIPYSFGVAMLLAPEGGGWPAVDEQIGGALLGCVSVSLTQEKATVCTDSDIEALRLAIPTARALPLLSAVARGASETVVIDYLGLPNLQVEWSAHAQS